MSKVQVVVSGLGWMGSGIGSIESAIEELLQNSQHEILVTAYSIGKADRIFDLLESALARGVRVRMIINRLPEQYESIQRRLAQFQKKYPYFVLRSFEPDNGRGDLHAKVLVVDRQRALVGPSNLSYNGIILNHELAVIVEAEDAAKIASAIDTLIGC
ncbi:MAG: phospholipase D-like domain-containing protein [Anaerolineales bacterium]|nr:phospholipase D-like domain-containing protein [Anaerolineales bacterium]